MKRHSQHTRQNRGTKQPNRSCPSEVVCPVANRQINIEEPIGAYQHEPQGQHHCGLNLLNTVIIILTAKYLHDSHDVFDRNLRPGPADFAVVRLIPLASPYFCAANYGRRESASRFCRTD